MTGNMISSMTLTYNFIFFITFIFHIFLYSIQFKPLLYQPEVDLRDETIRDMSAKELTIVLAKKVEDVNGAWEKYRAHQKRLRNR